MLLMKKYPDNLILIHNTRIRYRLKCGIKLLQIVLDSMTELIIDDMNKNRLYQPGYDS